MSTHTTPMSQETAGYEKAVIAFTDDFESFAQTQIILK